MNLEATLEKVVDVAREELHIVRKRGEEQAILTAQKASLETQRDTFDLDARRSGRGREPTAREDEYGPSRRALGTGVVVGPVWRRDLGAGAPFWGCLPVGLTAVAIPPV